MAISKELGIARNTVRKYACAEKPTTKKLSTKERANLMALRRSTAAVPRQPDDRHRMIAIFSS